MASILVVCTANICRSPVGEGFIRQRLAKTGLVDWDVLSAGTWAAHVRPAAQYSQEVMADIYGIDISGHQAKMVTAELIEEADLVLCMARNHVEGLSLEFREHTEKIFRLSEMIGELFDIADPYGQTRPRYERMAEQVWGIIDEGWDEIIKRAGK
ncbi:MAG TPA: hypothetical protein VLL52_22625 [Anaerolineae bacterium]|nr:hypothetical protein [Anaerolineae bacterium]